MNVSDWLQLLDWEVKALFIGIILISTLTNMYLQSTLNYYRLLWCKLWSTEVTIEAIHADKCNELSNRQAACSSVEEHAAMFEAMRQYRNTHLVERKGYLALIKSKQPIPEDDYPKHSG